MKKSTVLRVILVFLQIQWAVSFFDPLTLGVTGIVAGLIYTLSSSNSKSDTKFVDICKTEECCNDRWIKADIRGLDYQLGRKLHGQQIAHKIVIGALRGHASSRSSKALAMSFHGLPGSGKNFVAGMIADAYFRKGPRSKYYHFFNGRTYAPDEQRLQYYQEQMKGTIARSLLTCPKSMFVFDEVDMMPEGLLNVLVPFLDYVQETTVDFEGERLRVTTNEAIFIFLSNTGSGQIMKQMIKFWTEGVDRNTMTHNDFENLIAVGAFNEKGGFQKSDAIRTNVIDFYVPFLPLEEVHVKRCMNDAFIDRINEKPTREMEDEVLSIVTYGPEPHNIYAKSGCKKIEQKIISVIYQSRHSD